MNVRNAEECIMENGAPELAGGQSGAKVYDIEGKYVFKTVSKKTVGEEIFLAYQKEAKWYQHISKNHSKDVNAILPEILDIMYSDEEIKLLVKRYEPLRREHLNDALLQEVMTVLAKVHEMEIPSFLQDGKKEAQLLTDEEIKNALEGWISVLQEHPGEFGLEDEELLNKIATHINKIIRWHDLEEHVLTHGDFHFDNLLQDENGNIVICDWQGVGVGAASGDLSFFISRLTGDGIPLDKRKIIEFYSRAMKELSGKTVSVDEISGHMDAANLITSFRFWHFYLHGSDAQRVQGIFTPMIEAYDALLQSVILI